MAGKMMGHKGMRAAKAKQSPANPFLPPTPHKNPRSAHIREANGGYIMSANGGDGDSMGADHVAPDLESAMARLKAHMGGSEEGTGDTPNEAPADETAEMDAPPGPSTPAAPPTPPPPAKKAPPKKKANIKLRAHSETY